ACSIGWQKEEKQQKRAKLPFLCNTSHFYGGVGVSCSHGNGVGFAHRGPFLSNKKHIKNIGLHGVF
ncbi:hypothetical protein, partial [Vibrio sp. 10N.222.49.C9]|uniref:hypothetical protein n=1 Tax=Vibrio sp. 10N.222.49.C9 TaxID=3229615 RepID=UPI00354C87BE